MKINSVSKGYGTFDLIPRDDVAGWAIRFYLCPEPATYPPELYGASGCARCGEKIAPGHMCADVAEYMTTDVWEETAWKMSADVLFLHGYRVETQD